ncbi:MAG: hypothetical protein R3F65_29815 [bacterium]
MAGESARSIHRNTGIDRRTVQRYIDAAEPEGLARKSHASALTDELVAAVKSRFRLGNLRPLRRARQLCEQHRGFIAELVEDDVKATKIRTLLARKKQAEAVPTLARFIRDELRPAPSPTVCSRPAARTGGAGSTSARWAASRGAAAASRAVGAGLRRGGLAAHVRLADLPADDCSVHRGCEAAWTGCSR